MDIRLANILGYLLGDGWISVGINSKGSKYYVSGFGGDIEDLELIKKDLINYGDIGSAKIHTYNTSSEKYGIKGVSNYFICTKKITELFINKGMPIGKRVEQSFDIPESILNGSVEIKRAFISGLYSAEGSVPTFQKNDITPKAFSLCMTKRYYLKDDMVRFTEQLVKILNDIGIDVSVRYTKTFTCEKNIKAIITIKNTSKNILNFINNIDCRYCYRKRSAFNNLKDYIILKENFINKKQKAYEEYLECNDAEYISKKYDFSTSTIRKWKHRKPNNSVGNNFISFNDFLKQRGPL